MAATIRNFAWVINGDGRERAEGKEEGRDNDRTLSPPSGKEPDGREGARKFKLERRNPRHLGD